MSKKQDKNIRIFINEIYFQSPRKNYETNKIVYKAH